MCRRDVCQEVINHVTENCVPIVNRRCGSCLDVRQAAALHSLSHRMRVQRVAKRVSSPDTARRMRRCKIVDAPPSATAR